MASERVPPWRRSRSVSGVDAVVHRSRSATPYSGQRTLPSGVGGRSSGASYRSVGTGVREGYQPPACSRPANRSEARAATPASRHCFAHLRVANRSDPFPPPPPMFPDGSRRLLTKLARNVDATPSSLQSLWTNPTPLDRRSEQRLGWALLLQACEERGSRPTTLAHNLGLPRGTLQRCSIRLLGWSLDDALRDSAGVRRRFAEWQSETAAFGSSHPPPPTTVRDLTKLWLCDTSTFRLYWGQQIPLKCRSKQLLSWSMLFWALRQRRRGKRWDAIASRARCRRRTLERYSRVLAGSGLKAATDEPTLAARAIWAWARQVWKTE